MKRICKIIPLIAVFAPAKIFACAACYGHSDDRMAVGMNWAIFTLGIIITVVLGAFLTFLIYAIRKSEAVEAARTKAAATKPAFQARPAREPLNQPVKIEKPEFA